MLITEKNVILMVLVNKWIFLKNKNDSTRCISNPFINLAFISTIIWAFVLILFMLMFISYILSLKLNWHLHVNAWNHYSSIFFILVFSILNYNSLGYLSVTSFALFPYFAPLIITVCLFEINYSDIVYPTRGNILSVISEVKLTSSIKLTIGIYFFSWLWYLCLNLLSLFYKILRVKTFRIFTDNSSFFFCIYILSFPWYIIYFGLILSDTLKSVGFLILFNVIVGITWIIYYIIYADFKYAIETYSMKIFNLEKEQNKHLDWFFSSLKHQPEALVFNILHNIKKLITALIISLTGLLYLLLSGSNTFIVQLVFIILSVDIRIEHKDEIHCYKRITRSR